MTRFFKLLAASLFLLPLGVIQASDAPLPDSSGAPLPDSEVPGAVTPIDIDHTSSIVGIQIGTRIAAFIFISTDGKHLNVGADECARSDKCQAIMAQLGKNGQTELIHFEPSHEDAAPPAVDNAPSQPASGISTDATSLPHRSMREIDIQGHQAGTSADPCPGQYRENVPESGLFLYCWGRKL